MAAGALAYLRRSTRWPADADRARLTRWRQCGCRGSCPASRTCSTLLRRRRSTRDGRRDASFAAWAAIGGDERRPRGARRGARRRRGAAHASMEGLRKALVTAARARGPLHDVGTARHRHERREERGARRGGTRAGSRTRRPRTWPRRSSRAPSISRQAVRVHPRRPEREASERADDATHCARKVEKVLSRRDRSP